MLPYIKSDEPFDCLACQDPESKVFMPPEVRAGWHCGWMERDEWTHFTIERGELEGNFVLPDGGHPDICPGYLAALPQMREAASALWALRKNVLSEYHPNPSSLLLDAVKQLDQSYAAYEAKRTAEAGAKV